MKLKVTHPHHDDYERMAAIYDRAVAPFYAVYDEREKIAFAGQRHESPEELREDAKSREYLCLKYENDDLLGYASFRQKSPAVIWLSALYIEPALQHLGHGSFLLRAVEEYEYSKLVQLVALETHRHATWAIRFYQKNGYRIVNEMMDHAPYNLILEQPPVPNRPVLVKQLLSLSS